MAEPAKRLDDEEYDGNIYDQPGAESSDPRPHLRSIEGGGDTTEPKRGHLREAGAGKADTPSPEDLSSIEGSGGSKNQAPRQQSEPKSTHVYTPGRNPKKLLSRLKAYSKTRIIVGGGIVATIITLIVILFSLLNVFKLDGLMSNIEQRALLRNNASISTRSSKWISAYIEARMFEVNNKPGSSTIFRSNRVDTNNPFLDWYRTMRTSKFEQQLYEADGIKFVSVHENGKIFAGRIDINGEKSIPLDVPASDYEKIAAGDIQTINKYLDYLNLEKFDSNRAARQAIKAAVYEKTEWWQVFKRRGLRKAIQNMTGVRSWSFFETTKDKITNKKIDVRNRILNDMLPDDSIIAKIARCFYGLSSCRPSTDVDDAQFRSTGEVTAEPGTPSEEETTIYKDAGISDALRKVLAAANILTKILNVPAMLDMLTAINQNLSKLVKLVVVARGAQAAGLFQVFETSRDQMKTGQLNSQEVNAFMENIDTAASSDGWTKVVEGNGNPSTAQSTGTCSQQSQAQDEKTYRDTGQTATGYAPLCADQRISSAANAQMIQDEYNQTIGPVVGPIVHFWSTLKGLPIIGDIIGLLEKIGNFLNSIISAIIKEILSILGLQHDVEKAIAWVFAKTSNFLGISIIKGYESAGTMFNWLVQGGAYSAESASRQEGAALTTNDSQKTAQNNIAQLTKDQQQESTLYDRVASLNNTNSLAFKGLTALSNIQSNPSEALMSSLRSMWTDAARSFGNIIGGKLYAATPDGYVADKFAGIQTYDFPQQCYDQNPIDFTYKPINGTNALAIFAKYHLKITDAELQSLESWATETDSNAFYDLVYSIILRGYYDKADTIAEQIYNCNLLDATVRGSTGYLFGYTNANSNLLP